MALLLLSTHAQMSRLWPLHPPHRTLAFNDELELLFEACFTELVLLHACWEGAYCALPMLDDTTSCCVCCLSMHITNCHQGRPCPLRTRRLPEQNKNKGTKSSASKLFTSPEHALCQFCVPLLTLSCHCWLPSHHVPTTFCRSRPSKTTSTTLRICACTHILEVCLQDILRSI